MKIYTIFILSFFLWFSVYGQDDTYEQLIAEVAGENAGVTAVFPGSRLVNGQSTELPGPGELHLMINHRFGMLKGGSYEFYGLDQAEIRIGFDYGITKFLSAGIGRSSYQKTYDINLKAKLLNQNTSVVPVNATVYISSYHNTLKNIFPENKDNFTGRQSYNAQILLSYNFINRISVLLTGGILHENYNFISFDKRNYGYVGGGTGLRVSKRVSINMEYYAVQNKNETSVNPFSIDIDLDTGGHLFQLIFSNTQSPFDKAMLTETSGAWSKGEIFFGFNLIRSFYLKKIKHYEKR